MAQTTAESPAMHKLLDRIVKSPQHLLVLEAANVGDVLSHLRLLALRSGTSMYLWDPEDGIVSLRESGMQVPGSKRFPDALRYVLQSMHFGVYLFAYFAEHLKPADTVVLRRISRQQGGNDRKLVFIGEGIELPEELEGLFERLSVSGESGIALRLRDGRWVRS